MCTSWLASWQADQLVTFFAPSLPVWKWHCLKQSVGLMKALFLPAMLPLLSYTMLFDNETLERINRTTFSPHLDICLVPGYHGILSITENNYLLLITWKILESYFLPSTIYSLSQSVSIMLWSNFRHMPAYLHETNSRVYPGPHPSLKIFSNCWNCNWML